MRKGIFVLVLVLLVGIVSAHGTYWNMDGGDVLSYEKIENPNRFPIETYVFGYTYRATDDFKKRYEIKRFRYVKPRWEEMRYSDWNRDYYYKWSSHFGRYEKIECYHSAPKEKLFYRRCP